MSFKEILIEIGINIFGISVLLGFIFLGWFLVWKLFLRRFRFIQELFFDDEQNKTEHKIDKEFRTEERKKSVFDKKEE